MKSRLILVGNKPIEKDISNEIDSFDCVVRLNRMNNYGKTGTKTDFLATDLNKYFFQLVEKPYTKYLNAKKLILNIDKYSLKHVGLAISMHIFSLDQMKNSIKLNFMNITRNLGYDQSYGIHTNFFKILTYIIANYSNDHEIWITGIDIKNRGYMFSTEKTWEKYHKNVGYYEEEMINRFIELGKVHFYEDIN